MNEELIKRLQMCEAQNERLDGELAAAKARIAELEESEKFLKARNTWLADRDRAIAAEARIAELEQQLVELDHCREAASRTEDAEKRVAELEKPIKEAIEILSTYIVPDSGISDTACVNQLIGIFDNKQICQLMGIAAPHGGQPATKTHSQECPVVERGEAAPLSDELHELWAMAQGIPTLAEVRAAWRNETLKEPTDGR